MESKREGEKRKKKYVFVGLFKKVGYAADADGSPDCISACKSISLHWSGIWVRAADICPQQQLEAVGVY